MWWEENEKPAAIKRLPQIPPFYGAYLDAFTMLRNRLDKDLFIPISEIKALAESLGMDVSRTVKVVAACDSAWMEERHNK